MSDVSVDVVRLDAVDEAAHRRYAMRVYGAAGVPARPSFLRWLYDEAPHGRGRSLGVVAVAGDEVVGAVHALRLPFHTPEGRADVVVPNHLHVDPAHRTGVGLALVLEGLRGSRDALLLGASADVVPVYERLGAARLPSHALVSLAAPVRGAATMALAVSAPAVLDAVLRRRCDTPRRLAAFGTTLRLHGHPPSAALQGLTEALVRCAGPRRHVAYDESLLRWRFFHPLGPRCLLVELERRGRTASFAVLSLGVRRRVPLARVVVFAPASDDDAGALARAVRLALTTLEVPVALAAPSDAQSAEALASVGFVRRTGPASFALRRPKGPPPTDYALDGGASDQGFDALPTTAEPPR